ncbi:MAG: hypothetical protein Tsb0020_02290 [Haliangiales bacterium]
MAGGVKPKTLIFAITGVAVALAMAVTGLVVSRVMSALPGPGAANSAAPATSFFETPTAIRETMAAEIGDAWMAQARMLTIRSDTAELMVENDDGLARRYTIYGRGDVLRRGGAYRVAAAPFDLGTLALERLPAMLDQARRVSEREPHRVVVGRDETGALLWRIVMSGGGADVYFDAEGDHIANPDAPG